MKKTIIMDLDDTLFKHTWLSRFFWKLSQFFYKLGIRSEKRDGLLWFWLKGYKWHHPNSQIIILTGRNINFFEKITKEQLKRNNIDYEGLIMCSKNSLVLDWKKRIVKNFKNVIWLDNEKI